MQNVDSLLHARWVIPVEPDDLVLEQHSVAITDGRIVALMPTEQAGIAASINIDFGETGQIVIAQTQHTQLGVT